jgi:hypothetical protein
MPSNVGNRRKAELEATNGIETVSYSPDIGDALAMRQRF